MKPERQGRHLGRPPAHLLAQQYMYSCHLGLNRFARIALNITAQPTIYFGGFGRDKAAVFDAVYRLQQELKLIGLAHARDLFQQLATVFQRANRDLLLRAAAASSGSAPNSILMPWRRWKIARKQAEAAPKHGHGAGFAAIVRGQLQRQHMRVLNQACRFKPQQFRQDMPVAEQVDLPVNEGRAEMAVGAKHRSGQPQAMRHDGKG